MEFLQIVLLLIILVAGLVLSHLSKKSRVPPVLSLTLLGILVRGLGFRISSLFFPIISTSAIILVVFDAVERFRHGHFDDNHKKAIKTGLLYFVISIFSLGILLSFYFNMQSMTLALIFAGVLTIIDPRQVFDKIKIRINHFKSLLTLESELMIPLIVFFIFVLFDVRKYNLLMIYDLPHYLIPFLQRITIGFGVGISLGIIVFGLMKKFYDAPVSKLMVILLSFLAYGATQWLGGDGIFAVISIGIMFANLKMPHKRELEEFEESIMDGIEVLACILFGYLLNSDLTFTVVSGSLVVFWVVLLVRFFTVMITHIDEHHGFNDWVFMTLTCPRGYATIVVALAVGSVMIDVNTVPTMLAILPEGSYLMNVVILVTLYSLFLSWIVALVDRQQSIKKSR